MQISTTANPTPVDDARLEEIHANPGFGQHFTDHMLPVEWTPDAGWHDARIQPYGPLTLDPATAVLHYAQETFEGMKAYRHDDGSVWTFRPEQNAARMVRSSQRLAFPELPVEDFVAYVDALVEVDQRWVPDNSGGGEKSLYLRPVHVRLRDVPRRPAGPARHLHGDRVAGRAPTSRAASSRSTSGCRRPSPAPVAAAWARPRPAATTPRPSPPSARRSRRAATRSCSSTTRSSATSRSSAG